MHRSSAYQIIGIILLSLTLNGFFYRPNVQQGNIMTEGQIAQLRQGMTIREVKKLLGTPVLAQTAFDKPEVNEKTPLLDRDANKALDDEEKEIMKMEYVYFYQPGYGQSTRQRVSLVFEDEKLIEFKVLT